MIYDGGEECLQPSAITKRNYALKSKVVYTADSLHTVSIANVTR